MAVGPGPCTVVLIRDRRRQGWVLYPHGVAGHGVLITDEGARTLAGRLGSGVMTPGAAPIGLQEIPPIRATP